MDDQTALGCAAGQLMRWGALFTMKMAPMKGYHVKV